MAIDVIGGAAKALRALASLRASRGHSAWRASRSHSGTGCTVFIAACLTSHFALANDVKSVERLELNRYLGKWHEVASIPQFFQRKCVRDTIAEYSALESGEVRVENTCTRADTGREKAEGRARVEGAAGSSKLTVTFVDLFGAYRYWAGGDYWVIELDPQYRWAVIGHPTRRYGWVLSRTAALPQATLAEIIGRIKSQGYDACEFMVTPQTGGLSLKRPLCNAIQ